MKTWFRVLMIVAGIMIALALVTFTDPSSIKSFIREKYNPARLVLGRNDLPFNMQDGKVDLEQPALIDFPLQITGNY